MYYLKYPMFTLLCQSLLGFLWILVANFPYSMLGFGFKVEKGCYGNENTIFMNIRIDDVILIMVIFHTNSLRHSHFSLP